MEHRQMAARVGQRRTPSSGSCPTAHVRSRRSSRGI